MKKLLAVLILALMFVPQVSAQTVFTVFDDGITRNTAPDVELPFYYTDGGRELHRIIKRSDNELPYNLFDNPLTLSVYVHSFREWSNGAPPDDYLRSWSLQIIDVAGVKYTMGAGYTPYGEGAEYTFDATMFIPILAQDSIEVIFRMDTWSDGTHYNDVDFTFTADPNAPVAYWIEPIANNTAGVWNEQADSRWEKTMVVPGDTKDRNIMLMASGTGEYQFEDVPVKLFVDGTEVYEQSPWVESCEYTLPYNNQMAYYEVDTADVIAGRTGFCWGGLMEPSIIKGDVFNSVLTPGLHTVRLEPQFFEVDLSTSWSDFRYHASMYGGKDEGAQAATKIETALQTHGYEYNAHNKKIPITLYFMNDADQPIFGTEAQIQMSSSGDILFSTSGETGTWENPLTFDQNGASRQVYAKATTAGEHTIEFTDLLGGINSIPSVTMEFHENFASYSTPSANNSCAPHESPAQAIDGDLTTKWCNNIDPAPQTLWFALDQARDINYFVIYHAGLNESPQFNTADYRIEVKNTASGNWEVFADVTDNFPDERGNVTYHLGNTVNADSVKFVVVTPSINDNVSRIPEVEFYLADGNVPTDVTEEADLAPALFELRDNYPNPFNPSTNIEFAIANTAQVDVVIYNVLGQQVSHLLSGQLNAGVHKVTWAGNNSAGQKVAGGIYLYSVRVKDSMGNNFLQTKKMVFLP